MKQAHAQDFEARVYPVSCRKHVQFELEKDASTEIPQVNTHPSYFSAIPIQLIHPMPSSSTYPLHLPNPNNNSIHKNTEQRHTPSINIKSTSPFQFPYHSPRGTRIYSTQKYICFICNTFIPLYEQVEYTIT